MDLKEKIKRLVADGKLDSKVADLILTDDSPEAPEEQTPQEEAPGPTSEPEEKAPGEEQLPVDDQEAEKTTVDDKPETPAEATVETPSEPKQDDKAQEVVVQDAKYLELQETISGLTARLEALESLIKSIDQPIESRPVETGHPDSNIGGGDNTNSQMAYILKQLGLNR